MLTPILILAGYIGFAWTVAALWIGWSLLEKLRERIRREAKTKAPHTAMSTRLPQAEVPSAAIATLLAVCTFVCGLFGFGFYKLMQAVQFPNPGLAAFKPPIRQRLSLHTTSPQHHRHG
jgi:hypothetical protein